MRRRHVPPRRPQLARGELPGEHAHADAARRNAGRRTPRAVQESGHEECGSTAWPKRGWTVPTWPTEYGGAGLDKDEQRGVAGGAARINARPALVGMGVSMIGPALLEYGNAGAEGRASAEDRARRDLVVSGLQRTERGLGSREPEDERGRTRRRIRDQRLEDLDVGRRPRRLDLLSRAHRPEGAETRRHHVHPVRHGINRASPSNRFC